MADARQARQRADYKSSNIHLRNLARVAPDNPEVRYLLGMNYSDSGEFAYAEIELRNAREMNYDAVKVVPALGKVLLALKKYQKVLDEINIDAAADETAQAQIMTYRGLASLGLGRVPEGRDLLAQALHSKQPPIDAMVAQAMLDGADNRIDEASRLINRALEVAPDNVDAWLLRGDLDRVMQRDTAAAAYLKVLAIDPRNVLASVNLVSITIAAGKYDEARKLIGELKKIAPDNPIASYMEGLIEVRTAHYAAARALVMKALQGAPTHLPSLLLAGIVEYGQGHYAQAQIYLTRVVDRAPNNRYARQLLISSLARTGRVSAARELLRYGLAQAPDDVGMLILAGEVAVQANDAASAGKYFEMAAKLDPKSASARTGLAVSRMARGETDRAFADLEAAIALDPTTYQADLVLVTSRLRRQEYEPAMKALQSLEKKQPKNPLTHNLKGAIHLGKKEFASAREDFTQALALQPTYLPAALNLALLDIADGDPKTARKRIETLLDKDENNVQLLLALADLAPRIGATEKEQVSWLKRAHLESPEMMQPTLMLARVYAQSRQIDKAVEVLQAAQVGNSQSVELLSSLGAAQIAADEKKSALSTYERLVTLQPKGAVAFYNLANAQMLNSDIRSASNSLRQALVLEPDYVDAQMALVGVQIRARQFEDATKIARQVQKQAPKSPIGYVLEGDVLMAEKKFPEATKLYETANVIGASGALAIKIHAAQTQAGKPEEADARLAQWIKLSPDDIVARLYAGDSALKAGDYKRAIGQYEWLQQRRPDDTIVLNNLAQAYQEAKDARALPTAERAYKFKPEDAEIADTLGWILVEQGKFPRGIELLQKAVDTAPKVLSIRYHLAQGAYKAGDKAKARKELERLLSTDTKFPQQEEAAALLRQLKN